MDHSVEKPEHLRASGTSLGNVWEILYPLLDAVQARSVVEIGAFRGELTSDLLSWAAQAKAHVVAVDPEPPPALEALGQAHSELELIRQTSLEALRQIPSPDAVIIDGDHNYYTVSLELRVIDGRFGASGPLLMLADVQQELVEKDQTIQHIIESRTYAFASRLSGLRRRSRATPESYAPRLPRGRRGEQ